MNLRDKWKKFTEKCGARSDNADSIIWIKELDDSSAAFYFISCQWNIVFAGGSCVH